MPAERVTIADLARRVGCDKSTVSRALRGERGVSEEMQARVKATAEALHYVPDTGSQRMAARRWGGVRGATRDSLALLRLDRVGSRAIPWEEKARRETQLLGYGFERLVLAEFPSARAAANVLLARGVRGLLLGATIDTPAGDWRRFPWEEFCAVQLKEGRLPAFGRAVFRQDATGNLLSAAERLSAAGVRSLACLLYPLKPASESDLRYQTAWSHVAGKCAEAGLKVWDAANFSPEISHDRLFGAMARWVEKMEPEGVIVQTDGLTPWLEKRGIRVGKDVQLVVLEGGCAECAGFNLKMDELIRQAVHHLHYLVLHDLRGTVERPDVLIKPAEWVAGASLRAGRVAPPRRRLVFRDAPALEVSPRMRR